MCWPHSAWHPAPSRAPPSSPGTVGTALRGFPLPWEESLIQAGTRTRSAHRVVHCAGPESCRAGKAQAQGCRSAVKTVPGSAKWPTVKTALGGLQWATRAAADSVGWREGNSVVWGRASTKARSYKPASEVGRCSCSPNRKDERATNCSEQRSRLPVTCHDSTVRICGRASVCTGVWYMLQTELPR